MMNKLSEIMADLFAKMGDMFAEPFKKIPTLHNLIYGGDEKLAFLTFTEKEITNVYVPGMNMFIAVAVCVILISIVIAGMKISASGINPSNRTYIIDYFKELTIVALLFANIYAIYSLLFLTNQSIVNLFNSESDLLNLKDTIEITASNGVLGMLAIQLIKIGLGVWAYFYYTMRKFTLMLLLILGPLMLALYLIPKTRGMTIGWAKELIGTVFVQSVHAACYYIMSKMTTTTNGVEGVILMMVFIPVTESVRALLGLGGQMNDRLSKTAAMMGGSALMGMYGAAKGAMDGVSVGDALKKLRGGRGSSEKSGEKAGLEKEGEGTGTSDLKSTLGGNTGTDTGTTPKAERMLKGGEILSRGGKAVFGAAGTLIGSPMGPMGSMVGSTVGFNAGGAIGGLAGRAGTGAAQLLGSQVKKGAKAGWNKGKGVMKAESKADEKTANSVADSLTSDWANTNEADFKKDFQERFPDAHESSVEAAWDDAKAAKKDYFLNEARNNIAGIKGKEGKNARASDLIKQSSANLTKKWANDTNNKKNFDNKFNQENKLPANATPKQKQEHNNKRAAAWKQAVNAKQMEIESAAKEVAGEMGNGSDHGLSFISKAGFNENLADKLSGGFSTNKANEVSNNLAKEWAPKTKDNYMKEYDQMNPLPTNANVEQKQAHENGKEASWKHYQGQQQKKIAKILKRGSKSVASGAGSSTSVGQQLAVEVGNELGLSQDSPVVQKLSNQIVESMNGLTPNKEKALSNKSISSVASVNSATSAVKGTSLYSGKEVNIPYLRDQLAGVKVDEARNDFVNNSSLPKEQAVAKFNSGKAKSVYENARQSLPRSIPLDNKIIQNKIGRMATAVGAGVGTGALVGAANLSGITAIKGVSDFMADTKLGKGVKAAGTEIGDTFKTEMSNLRSVSSMNPVQRVSSASVRAVAQGAKTGFTTAKNHIADNVEGKQAGFKNVISYASGMVGGVSGYQKGSNYAASNNRNMKAFGLKGFNPYNNGVQKQTSEIADISHLAQTVVGPDGQQTIADGAIQMVTTNGETVLQVRDKTGQTQSVSRLASGHSGLRKGQKVYQDLTVQNGNLVPTSNSYQYDSGGAKVSAPPIHVNPNKLVANRNTPKNPRVIKEVQSYNQQVDSGQYYVKNAVAEMDNIRMVVDRNRSYMVGKKNGQDYRISPYGSGDARLTVNDVIETKCEVQNRRLVATDYYKNDKPDKTFTTSLKPNDLMTYDKPNKRNMMRKQAEQYRNKAFTGPLRG
ncbi:type IV secretion system protein [Niallia taxi]|uniref:type IV secretion system protein n=1 Tax=Niallia taxi TaxID=2499688 RepID=UPI003172EE20